MPLAEHRRHLNLRSVLRERDQCPLRSKSTWSPRERQRQADVFDAVADGPDVRVVPVHVPSK